ncbi:ATP-binding protein [Colwellia sp. 4_MG-2023]|uniref:sensor histidine kinase n=1 Tax=unclassified Colwellia TaxID=196834 RepID=UPI0026E29B33|nr:MULTISPECIES: ATP-binding protein [unclassified Colwellia]MDO6508796.1 ATP-binding protein [Colwellia sp. 5_MG-2023]MDO6557474.1 ATP-binding protein [Colwellia sp. 4_MG-2023]
MWLERFKVFTRTSIWRFTLIFTFIVLLICSSILALVYQFTVGEQKRQIATQVTIAAQGFSDLSHSPSMTKADFQTAIQQRIDRSGAIILVLKNDDNVIGNLSSLPKNLAKFPSLQHFPIAVVNHLGETTVEIVLGTNLETRFGSLSIALFDNNYQVLESRFITASVGALLFALIVTLISGFLLNQRVLSRVKQIGELTANVKAGRLKSRLPISSKQDEFDMIADQINQMLDEIDDLINSVAQVTDNVAHDLRTPLSRIRISVEDSLTAFDENSADAQWRIALLDEIDQIIDTFNAMLELSRLEKGVPKSTFKTVNIETLCEDVIDLATPLAEEKNQKLTLNITIDEESSLSRLKGEPNLLFRAIFNVVDNAIKYTQAAGNIALTCHISSQQIDIVVCDNGPGIAKEYYDAVFRRLYQVDSSRQGDGFGLGLPIVKAIVELHGGSISMSSSNPGLTVSITLKH